MKVILVQPPFTQLNAPYPAVHYLEAFLRERGVSAVSFDHSIALYRRIFSRSGLAKVFADAKAALEKRSRGYKSGNSAGDSGESSVSRGIPEMDEGTQAQVERYLSYELLYAEWIDGIVDFLSGGDPAIAHRLASAVELPRGARAEAFLAERGGRIGPDEARALATRILDDLGDFISFTLDPAFGMVRYAERLASSRADFGEVRAALDSSWLIQEFYVPMLEEFWQARRREEAAAAIAGNKTAEPIDFILVTIPFPGCLLGALACARAARENFEGSGSAGARRPRIIFGGGYVSTELRGLRDASIFDFCDYLSFDAGYGSLASIMDREAANSGKEVSLYRTMTRANDGSLIVAGFPERDSARFESSPKRILNNDGEAAVYRQLEREVVARVFPDYRNADFGAYLRIVDSENPMHRLWSDTPWLKYSLAHGCYWRRCSFCDTELEYVADFMKSKTEALLSAAGEASLRSRFYGIHFVDEAMPMAPLLDFARGNRARASAGIRPFSFWGNVRFDASWTQERCELLAASGLVAVSGGIEIATKRGLKMTDKGFDLASLVRTLVAMRRAGILVHAYLIYGFPGQPASDIIDSAEFCRQLFVSGLIDSAFWHRFVLTRHSRMYAEWRKGAHAELQPIDKPWSFANNDLSFEGEERFDPFDGPLATSLASWMEGRDLGKPLSAWFGRKAAKPSIAGDLVESLIALAETKLDEKRPDPTARAYWIAGAPTVQPSSVKSSDSNKTYLAWAYRGELRFLELDSPAANAALAILNSSDLRIDGIPFGILEERLALPSVAMAELLSAGLVMA